MASTSRAARSVTRRSPKLSICHTSPSPADDAGVEGCSFACSRFRSEHRRAGKDVERRKEQDHEEQGIRDGHVSGVQTCVLPILKIANLGAEEATRQDEDLANGLNVSGGKIRHEAVAEALDLPYEPIAG